jgi:hypothetical protein
MQKPDFSLRIAPQCSIAAQYLSSFLTFIFEYMTIYGISDYAVCTVQLLCQQLISVSVHYLDYYNIFMTRSIFIICHVANTAPRHDNFEKICFVADYSVQNMKCTNIFLGEIYRYVSLYVPNHL